MENVLFIAVFIGGIVLGIWGMALACTKSQRFVEWLRTH